MISDNDFRIRFGKILSRLRKESGMTQSQLADKLNYSDKSISKWERGESIPDTYTVYLIAQIFGVPISELLGERIDPDYRSPKQKRDAKTTFIPLIVVFGILFVASIIFFILKNIPAAQPYAWYSFLYALPAAGIVLTVFSSIWWKIIYKFLSVSFLIWSTGCAVYFSFQIEGLKYIFIPCALLEGVCALVFLFVHYLTKKEK